MSISLYKIATEIEELAKMELDDDTFKDSLESLEFDVESKILNIAKYVKNLDADAEQLKEFIKHQQGRLKAIENDKNRLLSYLSSQVDRLREYPIKTPEIGVTTRKSESINIVDVEQLPDFFINVKQVKTADKKEIKKAIKEGQSVDGAELQVKYNISIK